jgi:hypothetical protein
MLYHKSIAENTEKSHHQRGKEKINKRYHNSSKSSNETHNKSSNAASNSPVITTAKRTDESSTSLVPRDLLHETSSP